MDYILSGHHSIAATEKRKTAFLKRFESTFVLWIVLIFFCSAMPGCTGARLRTSTVQQASTLTNLQHQVVLNNLAIFVENPDAIPFQLNLHDGSTQISDLGQMDLIGKQPIESGITGSRTVVNSWLTTPVTDDVTLRLLRMAYRRALGSSGSLYDDECKLANDLAHELKKSTTVVDDIRSTAQVSAQPAPTQRSVEVDITDSQRKFVEALGRLLDLEIRRFDSRGYRIQEFDPSFERDAMNFARAVGDRNGDLIRSYGANSPLPDVAYALNQLGSVIDVVKDNPDERQLKAEVYQKIVALLSKLGPLNADQANRDEAAEHLFDVYRSWPEQSSLIGVRHREASTYRVDDHKVLTTNHSKMILPVEVEKNGEDYTKKLHEGNLDYVDLGKNYTYLITMDREDHDVRHYQLPIVSGANTHSKETQYFDVWDHIQANDVQKCLDDVFPGGFIVAGGPLSVNSPISISYVGDGKFKHINGKPGITIPPGSPNGCPFRVVPLHRYMKVTPMVAEVRRQVKSVEDDLEEIKGGWLHWSHDKHDVPKNACYQGQGKGCGGTIYVWVCSEGRKAFEDFTLKTLSFSNLVKNVQVTGSSGVKFLPSTSAPPAR